MLYIALPIGSLHGWGVCGRNLGRELFQLRPVRYLYIEGYDNGTSQFEQAVYGQITVAASDQLPTVIHSADDLSPWGGPLNARTKIALTFCDRMIPKDCITQWRGYWDMIIAGCKWCQQVLAEQGIPSRVIYQGIDQLTFHEGYATKQFLKDNFVIFSGGKFQYRKGQDLVIKAFKIFQERHRDAVLVASWSNMWPDSMKTMGVSPHIRFSTISNDYQEIVQQTLVENGIALDRVLILNLMNNSMLPQVYQNTDVGIFPNRAEGGTNLVLMEYMACGKPAIVTDFAGHKDVANEKNTLLLRQVTPTHMEIDGKYIGTWGEPSVSEMVEQLEWAYQHREQTAQIGRVAAASMKNMTWRAMAEALLAVLPEVEIGSA